MESKEHQLTAILFSDIVGYSAIMHRDEDEAWQVLQKAKKIHLELIERYNGKMLKELGDGFLICFSSVIDAVHCAEDLILEVANEKLLGLSIGIHLGDVIIKDGDVFGDGVNIASRLQQEAGKNEVLISESVYLNIKNQADISTDHIGPIELKNIDGPVTVYKLRDGRTHTKRKRVNPKAALYAGVILIILILAFMYSKFLDTNNEIIEPTIAVLPFENLSDDPNQEYFSVGVSDEIRSKLSFIQGLTVRGRSSSMYFKNKSKTLEDISKILDVNYVLEGSVRILGNTASFNLSLVDTQNDRVILPIQIENRVLDDLFQVQAEIAKMVAQNLHATLLPDDKIRVEKVPTENLDAHRYYLLARYDYLQGQSREVINNVLGYLDQAIKLDTNFANAYAMKAEVLVSVAGWGYQGADSVVTMAKPLAEKALKLDPYLSEAHQAMARIHLFKLDFDAAYEELREAIKLDPENDLIYYTLWGLMIPLNENEMALEAILKARKLNPFSALADAQVGLTYWHMGQLDSAIAELERNLERFQENDHAKWVIAGCYATKGEYDKAIEYYLDRSYDTKYVNFALGYTYARMGAVDSARKVLSYLINKSQNGYVPPSQIGLIYFGLGDKDSTYYWMEKAHLTKEWSIIAVVPLFDSLLTQSPYNAWFDFGGLEGQDLDF